MSFRVKLKELSVLVSLIKISLLIGTCESFCGSDGSFLKSEHWYHRVYLGLGFGDTCLAGTFTHKRVEFERPDGKVAFCEVPLKGPYYAHFQVHICIFVPLQVRENPPKTCCNILSSSWSGYNNMTIVFALYQTVVDSNYKYIDLYLSDIFVLESFHLILLLHYIYCTFYSIHLFNSHTNFRC